MTRTVILFYSPETKKKSGFTIEKKIEWDRNGYWEVELVQKIQMILVWFPTFLKEDFKGNQVTETIRAEKWHLS